MLLSYLLAAGYGTAIALAAKAWIGSKDNTMSCKTLYDMIHDGKRRKQLLLLDVRDPMPVGGKVKGAYHSPCSVFDGESLGIPCGITTVVVYCMNSNVAAPACAQMVVDSHPKNLHVFVLEGGYKEWVALYGSDRECFDDYEEMVRHWHCPIGWSQPTPSPWWSHGALPIVLQGVNQEAYQTFRKLWGDICQQPQNRSSGTPLLLKGPKKGKAGSRNHMEEEDEEEGPSYKCSAEDFRDFIDE